MIYLDNAATTLRKPPEVVRAVVQAMESAGNPGRGAHDAAMDAARMVYDTRAALSDLFHAGEAGQIAFTANATQSLNTAIKGLLAPGDHVITTAMEHNSVLRPLYEMQKKGASLTVVPCDRLGKVRYEDIKRAVRPETKAIVCTHASNVTGNLLDIGRVGEIAKAHGLLLIVDASQTAGVFPIDMQAMGIDALCFTGHKGLLGPQGVGGLAVRKGLHIRPLLSGGSGMQSFSREHPLQMPEALEAGTLNVHGIAGLCAALGYIQKTGMDEIRKREQALMHAFYQQAKAIEGVCVYGDFDAEQRCAIVALNVRDYDSAQVSDVLAAHYGIATRPGAHCAPLMHEALGTAQQGVVRVSFSHMNTMEEIDAAIHALREIAREE